MISAVIPTFGGRQRLARNLETVAASLRRSGDTWEILVVDDGGGDLGDPGHGARLIVLPRNSGYGPAVNAGVRAAAGDYLLILNDDVRLEPDCVAVLRGRFPDPSLFAAVPAIASRLAACGDEGGRTGVWRAGLVEIEEAPSEQEHPTLYPVGCCYLCPRAAFLALGGYHDVFAPFFWEDTDLGYRAWRRGWRVLHLPRARCLHEGSATLEERRSFEERETTFHRNRVLFHLRNLRDPRRRAECLGACAALALFEPRPPRRAGLAEAVRLFASAGRAPDEGLSDDEILRRAGGR